MKTTLQKLVDRVDAILASERQWTKHESARNSDGEIVPASSPEAVCWCLYGAMRRAYDELDGRSHTAKLSGLFYDTFTNACHEVNERGYSDIIWFNDHPDTKFSEIKAIIAKAKEAVS